MEIDMSKIGVEVTLDTPEAFSLIKETLTRIGVPSSTGDTLYQSVHILYKRNKYYICHFKELFQLSGNESNTTEFDFSRRNLIVKLLNDWSLLKINEPSALGSLASMSSIKIIKSDDRDKWNLVTKYKIGKDRNYND